MPNETSGRVCSTDGGPKELFEKSPLLLHCDFQSMISNGLLPISRAGVAGDWHRGRGAGRVELWKAPPYVTMSW
jgi:hypothetical protein